MKVNYSFIRVVSALAIGLVLVLSPDTSTSLINTLLGILFLVPGVILLIGYFANRKKTVTSPTGEVATVSKRFPIEGVGSALLGLWLIIDPLFFADLLMRVLSVIIIIAGVQQIVGLLRARRWKKVSFVYYIIPLLILGTGIYALVEPAEARNTVLMVIGIVCLVYAAVELFNWFAVERHKPSATIIDDGAAEAKPEEKAEEKKEE
jgi:uncharacterized membrane protein HdeD (DUF308 family)